MQFIKLGDALTSRVNLDAVVAYQVVTTSGSESITFETGANNAGALLSFDVAYVGVANPSGQVLADVAKIDAKSGASNNASVVVPA